MLKESGVEHWNSPNTGATNESGFTGLPSGGRTDSNGWYGNLGNYLQIWTGTEYVDKVWYRMFGYNEQLIYRKDENKKMGYSIRCLED